MTTPQSVIVVTNVCDGDVYNHVLPEHFSLADVQKFVVSQILDHEVHRMDGVFERDFLAAAAAGRWADAWKVYQDYDRECETGSSYSWNECLVNVDLFGEDKLDPSVVATKYLSMLEDDSDDSNNDC